MFKKVLSLLLVLLLLPGSALAWGDRLSAESLAFLREQGVEEAMIQQLLTTEQSAYSVPFEKLVHSYREDAQGLNESSLAFLREHHVDEALISKMNGLVERGKVYPFNREMASLKLQTNAYYFTDEQILEVVQRLVEPLPRFTKLDEALLWAIENEEQTAKSLDGARQQATAKLADFPITINGQTINNPYEQYPFLEYRHVTYFPLTEQNNQFAGLNYVVREKAWGKPISLVFYVGRDERSRDQWVSERRKEPISTPSFTVSLLNQGMAGEKRVEVEINLIDDNIAPDEMDYPLLCFQDTLYLPLTWQVVVEDLGWQYTYTEKDGLIIDSTDPLRPIYNYEVVGQHIPDPTKAIDYVYLPDGFIGYRPSTVSSRDMLIVYKKAGQPIKQVNVYPQLKDQITGEYFMNRQLSGELLEEAETQPYVEENILHILCASRQETFILQINLDTGEVLSIMPYDITGK